MEEETIAAKSRGWDTWALGISEPRHAKTCLMPYANNKGAVQPTHPRSLISAFVVCCLDRIILLVSISEISSL